MSRLGEYITNEYEVLVKVFSFLNSKDLANAAKVCREWNSVASRTTQKRNRPFGFIRTYKKTWGMHCYDSYLQPKVLLYFTSRRKKSGPDFFPVISAAYNLDNTSIYHIRNHSFIGSNYSDDCPLNIKSLMGGQDQTFVALCDMPGATINSFCIHQLPIEEEMIKNITLAQDNPKCLMIIAGGDDANGGLVDLVFSTFSKFSPLVIVGGVSEYAPILRQKPFTNAELTDHSVVCLSFHGENVIPHAAHHEIEIDLDNFMTKLFDDIGPLPTGGYRIAFIFSCINIYEMMRDKEINLFKSYFPNVPLYGLWSYGEYMTILNDRNLTFSPSRDWAHSECTSYLFLTFKREY